MSVRLLEVIMGGFTLCMHNRGPAWEEYAEYANTVYTEVGIQARCFAMTLITCIWPCRLDAHGALRTGGAVALEGYCGRHSGLCPQLRMHFTPWKLAYQGPGMIMQGIHHSDDLVMRPPQCSPCVGECLAEWIAHSDISAVHLNVRSDYAYANRGQFALCIRNLGTYSPTQN